MTLSGTTMSTSDGGNGAIAESNENILACIGHSTLGTENSVYSFSDADDVTAKLGYGPLAKAVIFHLNATKKTPILAVRATSDVAGSLTSPFTKSGTGPDVTSASVPNDAYQIKVKITKGGTLGVAEFQYSLDGGDIWSPVIVTAATYVLPNTNVTLAFAVGTYVLNDVYASDCVAPGYSTTNLGTAFDALVNSQEDPSLLHVVGIPVDHTTAATWAAAVQLKAEAAFAKAKYLRCFVEASDSTDANLITAFASTEAARVVVCAGFTELIDPTTLRVYKRPAAWPVAARAAKVKVQRHLGAVADKSLYGISSLLRDERVTEALSSKRFCVLKTIPGVIGFFVEQPHTMAAIGSDYASLHNGRVIDKACRYGYRAAMPYVNADWELGTGGRIAEHEARAIENEVQQQIANALLPDGNATAVQVVVNRTDDMLATSKLRMKIRVKPKGYSKFIEVDVGFAKNLAEAA
jgi:hypothetical protein